MMDGDVDLTRAPRDEITMAGSHNDKDTSA